MAEQKNRLRNGAIALALVLVGLALGLLVSRPLPKYLATGVPYTLAAEPDGRVAGMVQGDHLQYMYHLGQLRLAAEGCAPWFRNTYEFAGGYGFTEFYLYFPTALLYWPLSHVSEAFAYNAIVLLSFVGTMIAGYGLARAWGANRGGAFCAGVVLTLFPARLASLFGGHPAGSAFFLFPMAWWGLEKSWQTGRAAWGWLAAACVVLLSRLEPHFLFYLCFLLPFWAFWKLAEAGTFAQRTFEAAPSRKRSLRNAWPALVAALLFAGCLHYNQIRLNVIPGFGPQIIALVVFFLLVVSAMRWLIARIVEWLGVTDAAFRRRWLMLPWFAFWLLVLYFLAGAVEKPKYGIRLVRACVALFVIAHVVFLVAAAHGRLLRPGRIKLPWRQILRMWPVAVGLVIAVAYEMYLKVAVFDVSGVAGGRTLHEIRLFSVPFGKLFDRTTGNGDFIGWVVPLCVLIAALLVLSAKRSISAYQSERRRFWISAALFALGALLTCGPLLSAYFPLYETLYYLVPFFNFTRATAKYAILTATFGGISIALFATFLDRLAKNRHKCYANFAWLAILAAIIGVDHLWIARVGVTRLPRENKAYAHVAEHSDGAPLLEIPIWPGDSAYSAIYQYWTLRTNVPTVNGYSPTVPRGYIEHVSWPLYDVNYGRFGPREAALCKRLEVRYINFHEEAFPRKVSEFPATTSLKMLRLNPRLKLVAEDGPVHLFEILDEPEPQPAPALPFLSRYVPTYHLKKQVGRKIEDTEAIDGRAWASDGREGQLFYGPFAVLPTGQYVAIFRIKAHAANDDNEIGTLDVYAKRDKTPAPGKPLVELKLTGAEWSDAGRYRFIEIPFELEGTWVVETRGWFAGTPGTSLALDYVFIQSAPSRRSGPLRIEAEEMFHAPGQLAEEADASQGYLLKLEELSDRDAVILEERFLLLDKGTYRVTCAARQPPYISMTRWLVLVRHAGDSDPILQPSFELNFTIPERAVYGVSVQALAGGPEAVDYIELAPVE